MIRGMHGIFYTPKAEELRLSIRDKLGFPYTDIGDGWLIFDVPSSELACHESTKVFHSISFYCDNIHRTVEDLKSRGVEFTSSITNEPWGMLTHFRMPGGIEVELYEPKYKKHAAGGSSRAKTTRRIALLK